MKTDHLIHALARDLPDRPQNGGRLAAARLMAALLVSGLFVAAVILLFLAPSPHLAHGPNLTTAVTLMAALALTICAFRLSLLMQRPDARIGFGTLAWPILLLLVGVAIELILHPSSTWTRRLIGEDPLNCFLLVSGLSLPVLIAALGVLKQGAPIEPGLQGAMAGLLSVGVTSMLYVLHCPEPSLLYIAAWHVPAALAVSFIGAKLGRRWLRW
ncbi:NrsF family protein [Microvirga arabica]|uniref:NrsF family protein n=1 Tax=Microvirga arabica TaxID=1128671 RepID=A0ABV6Y975_9HYPH|nr:DUF1109 domain-containing protein [Microvirga arabica]MBM1170570.1 DUF1109 domain-containing protein [Microvirga arabica]